MTIKTTRRPRVLFINEYSGDTEADQAIRDVADVYWFHGLDYEAAVPVVREMVEQYGPFDAFAVSAECRVLSHGIICPRSAGGDSGRCLSFPGLVLHRRQVPDEMGRGVAGRTRPSLQALCR